MIDWACPAIDCRGRLDWLFDCDRGADDRDAIDAKTDCPKGQLGPFLSSARAKVEGMVEHDTLDIDPVTFTNRFVFRVEGMVAQRQEPPPEGDCPARMAARLSPAPE